MTKPAMKNRVDELVTEMSEEQESAIRILANELHRVNEAVMQLRRERPVDRIAESEAPSY